MKRKDRARQGERNTTRDPNRRPASRGVLLVKWAVEPRERQRLLASTREGSLGTARARGIEERLNFLRTNHGLREISPLFTERRRARRSGGGSGRAKFGAVVQSMASADDDLSGMTILRLDPKTDLAKVSRELRGRGVQFAEPSPMRWLQGQLMLDPEVSTQWGLQAVQWFGASRPDASRVGVAVVDSGVDRSHPDLKGAIEEYEASGFGVSNPDGHGTHVAGIIGAVTNNRVGIAGIAKCRLHIWKVYSGSSGEVYEDAAYLKSLADIHAKPSIKVLNLSLGGEDKSRMEEELLARLTKRGVLVVAAMGNAFQDGNPTDYPAAYDGVMAVGAVGSGRSRSSFSNTGRHISISAPGESILSTLPTRRAPGRTETHYASWDGTSMATPFVAGAAALVFARFPKYSALQVRRRLESTSVTVAAMKKKKWTKELGHGVLDLKRALARGKKRA